MISFLITGCYSQHTKSSDSVFKKIDVELHHIYQEYYQDRQDFGHEKDSLLPIFENRLQDVLSKKEFLGMSFDSLTKSKQVTVLESKDKKLYIYSWDTYNMGTWKRYNSMYQYEDNNRLYTGFLSEKGLTKDANMNFLDGFHFRIYDVDKNSYLVQGYGTHGSGHDFYTLRLLSFQKDGLRDCNQCFDGKDNIVLYKTRRNKGTIEYDPEKREIQYPEYKEDPDTGAMKPTGKSFTLQYKDGYFIKI